MVNCLLTVALVWLVKVTFLRVFGDSVNLNPTNKNRSTVASQIHKVEIAGRSTAHKSSYTSNSYVLE